MSKLKNTKILAITAMLAAVSIILSYFKIPLSPLIEIRFTTLPLAIAGFLFGPAIGGIVGLLADVGGYIIAPTGPFFPGFTISAIISGAIYGLILHHHEFSIKRIFIAQVIIVLVVNLMLNSLWLSMLYGKAFMVAISARLFKEIIMLPINTALVSLVLMAIGERSVIKKVRA